MNVFTAPYVEYAAITSLLLVELVRKIEPLAAVLLTVMVVPALYCICVTTCALKWA